MGSEWLKVQSVQTLERHTVNCNPSFEADRIL